MGCQSQKPPMGIKGMVSCQSHLWLHTSEAAHPVLLQMVDADIPVPNHGTRPPSHCETNGHLTNTTNEESLDHHLIHEGYLTINHEEVQGHRRVHVQGQVHTQGQEVLQERG